MQIVLTVKIEDGADLNEVLNLAQSLRKGIIDNLDGIEPPEVHCDEVTGYGYMVEYRIVKE